MFRFLILILLSFEVYFGNTISIYEKKILFILNWVSRFVYLFKNIDTM